jgi:hypothetical protein
MLEQNEGMVAFDIRHMGGTWISFGAEEYCYNELQSPFFSVRRRISDGSVYQERKPTLCAAQGMSGDFFVGCYARREGGLV